MKLKIELSLALRQQLYWKLHGREGNPFTDADTMHLKEKGPCFVLSKVNRALDIDKQRNNGI